MVQSMKYNIGEIVCVIERLDELAYNTYKPIVENICIRKASELEVEHLLDYMLDVCHDDRICNSDRMVELFKRVCRKYIYLYPEIITSAIYTYKEM